MEASLLQPLPNLAAIRPPPLGLAIHALKFPPAPLLANKGEANMLSFSNGAERTIAQFSELFEKGGWKLVRVVQGDGFEGENSKLIGIPV
ncbi:hypothetical protein EW026_g8085 [Hermanssonia centrifuga]|uniref:Uncharacterized protein n=1 Tax=Hermanssonia centrifuga TaxID=98765 RepID=A0A4S4K9Z1_9APHY|nr:hypothetical protein EW026_g8085 [Hermanssonia centrifuga]